jgi:hypothetical protein
LAHVADVADFIGELHQFCWGTQGRGVFDLRALAFLLEQGLIVRDLDDDAGDGGPKLNLEFRCGRVRIFDGVVKECRGEDVGIGDAGFVREHVGNGDRVVDVGAGFRTLAALVAVLQGGEGAGGEDDGYGSGAGFHHDLKDEDTLAV